jgi:pimeloyl-ACP methyl ester carboxylesterase
MDAPGEMIDIGGRRLHLLRRGQGVPAVILESGGGGGSSTQDWPLLGRVARFTHALSYDRAGLGWSDPAPAPKTFNGMAGDLDALLVAAGESPPFVLVGGSFGGLLVLAFCRRFPAKVAGAVILDAADEENTSRPCAACRRSMRLTCDGKPIGPSAERPSPTRSRRSARRRPLRGGARRAAGRRPRDAGRNGAGSARIAGRAPADRAQRGQVGSGLGLAGRLGRGAGAARGSVAAGRPPGRRQRRPLALARESQARGRRGPGCGGGRPRRAFRRL